MLWRSLKIVAVYAVAGPFIGLVVFASGVGLLAFLNGHPQGMWLGPFFLLYGIVFAHFIGAPWAVLAGGAAAVMSAWWGGRCAWTGPASGGVSFMAALMMGAARLPPGHLSPISQLADGYDAGFTALMAAVHILAATGAWMLARMLLGRA